MLRFFVTIIEKFCDAQPERKGGAANLSAARHGVAAVTSPPINRGICFALPNDTLRTAYNLSIPNLKPSQNSEISAQIYKWSRPLLIDSAPQTEFDATPRKQTTEKILTGARTHIRNFAKQPISARPSPVLSSQNGPPKMPQGGYKRGPERCTGRKNRSLVLLQPTFLGQKIKWGSRLGKVPGTGVGLRTCGPEVAIATSPRVRQRVKP